MKNKTKKELRRSKKTEHKIISKMKTIITIKSRKEVKDVCRP
jgi:hypothetical protein